MAADPIDLRPDFHIDIADVGGQTRLLVVHGEIDLAVRESLACALDDAVATGRRIVVDLSGVSFLDSTGIRALVRTAAGGADVSVLNPQRAVRHTLEVSGVDHLIHIVGRDTNHERTLRGTP
jgi:anti-anti-sigma factor